MSNLKIFCPSYKRANKLMTHKYLETVIYVVAEAKADDYKKTGVNLWIVPDSAQGNLCRIRNYILDNADVERILILDDDLKSIHRWNKGKSRRLNPDETREMLDMGFNLAEELGAVFWGINLSNDKGIYREYTPISLTAYIGGPFQAHLNNPCRYDESLPLKEDYDMTLQVLNQFRKNLRLNMYYYNCDQHGKPGGCAAYRTLSREKEQFDLLQKKWGSDIVKKDSGESKKMIRRKNKKFDINPIIKIPIKGV